MFATSAAVGKAAALALLLSARAILADPPALALSPCARDVGVAGAECGRLTVFEDRAAAAGRTLELKVVVLPALGREVQPDPLFLLAGGPGMPATVLADVAEAGMRRLRETRAIVLVDQRGTGELSPLQCDDVDADSMYYSFNAELPFDLLRDCLARFDADPRHYTTPVAMDDLDDVRAALGYDTINLWGGSYGTRAALSYLRRHGEHVRAVILDGVAPTALRMPVFLGEDAHGALLRMFADCEADADCHAAFPRVREHYTELLARLAATPEQARIPHPRTGELLEFDVGRDAVAFLLRAALYSAEATRLLPLVIERAHAGDYGPLLALSDPLHEATSQMNIPMLFSVLCAEDIGRVDDADRARMDADPFLGSAVIDSWGKVCDFWPRGQLPAGYHEPVVSDRPVLVLSGELDPVTPPRWGEAVAEALRNCLHVVVPGTAHGTSAYGCVPRLLARFLETASVDSLDAGCVDVLERPMFFQSFAGPRVGAAAGEAP